MGIGTILVIVLVVVLAQCMGVDIMGGGAAPSGSGDPSTANECKTGEDANQSDACAIDLFTTSVQNYWKQAYPEETGDGLRGRPDGAVRGIDRFPLRPGELGDGALLLPERPPRLSRHRASSTTCSRASSALRAGRSRSAT